MILHYWRMPGSGYRGISTGKYKVRLVEEYVTLYRFMAGAVLFRKPIVFPSVQAFVHGVQRLPQKVFRVDFAEFFVGISVSR